MLLGSNCLIEAASNPYYNRHLYVHGCSDNSMGLCVYDTYVISSICMCSGIYYVSPA